MLSARAYSFRQKSLLAISLSWIGGYTNLIALLTLGTVVSHLTGTATQLGRSLGDRNEKQVLEFGWLIFTFVAGAALSAFMIELGKRQGWRSKYIVPIVTEALLLALVGIDLARNPLVPGKFRWGLVGMASLGMGLQNATVTRISGAVIRTTHLTGIFTDLGIEGIQYLLWLRDHMRARHLERAFRLMVISRRHPSGQRILLLLSIASSFGCGSVVGYFAFGLWASYALIVPVAFLLWIVCVDIWVPIADIREMDLLNDPELKLQNLVTLLLPREVVLYRFACARGNHAHRAPNFQLWLERVPDHCQVVILAISPLTRFSANTALDLELAVRKLHAEGRTLIISGITPALFKDLIGFGVPRIVNIKNLCSDLEFAIARALTLVHPKAPRGTPRPNEPLPLLAHELSREPV